MTNGDAGIRCFVAIAIETGGLKLNVEGLPNQRRQGRVDSRWSLLVDSPGLSGASALAKRVQDLHFVASLQVDPAIAAVLIRPGRFEGQAVFDMDLRIAEMDAAGRTALGVTREIKFADDGFLAVELNRKWGWGTPESGADPVEFLKMQNPSLCRLQGELDAVGLALERSFELYICANSLARDPLCWRGCFTLEKSIGKELQMETPLPDGHNLRRRRTVFLEVFTLQFPSASGRGDVLGGLREKKIRR